MGELAIWGFVLLGPTLPNMKVLKTLLPFLAFGIAFYEQTQPHPNLYILVAGIVIGVIGIIRLSAKIPSKNQNEQDDDIS